MIGQFTSKFKPPILNSSTINQLVYLSLYLICRVISPPAQLRRQEGKKSIPSHLIESDGLKMITWNIIKCKLQPCWRSRALFILISRCGKSVDEHVNWQWSGLWWKSIRNSNWKNSTILKWNDKKKNRKCQRIIVSCCISYVRTILTTTCWCRILRRQAKWTMNFASFGKNVHSFSTTKTDCVIFCCIM